MRLLLALAAAALAATSGLAATSAPAASYDERRAMAVKECEAIDPAKYQSGLYFNPDGYRSYYLRSECFQRLAVRFRDQSLCARVKQRRSLFASSWGYSAKNCRALVESGLAKDRAELTEVRRAYLASHMTLTDFRVELNNNGRDFDIVPVAAGTTGHGYVLRFEVLADGRPPALLHEDGYYVGGSTLSLYIRRADVQPRVPDLSPDRRYQVRATMTFSLPSTTGDAEWSDAFLESVFPLRERTQTLTKAVVFPAPTMRR